MNIGPTVWLYYPYANHHKDGISEARVVKVGNKLAHLFDGRKIDIETLAMRDHSSIQVFLTRADLDAYLQHIADFSRMQNRVTRLRSHDVTREQVMRILEILN